MTTKTEAPLDFRYRVQKIPPFTKTDLKRIHDADEDYGFSGQLTDLLKEIVFTHADVGKICHEVSTLVLHEN